MDIDDERQDGADKPFFDTWEDTPRLTPRTTIEVGKERPSATRVWKVRKSCRFKFCIMIAERESRWIGPYLLFASVRLNCRRLNDVHRQMLASMMPQATALETFFQHLSGTICVSIAGTIFTSSWQITIVSPQMLPKRYSRLPF
jgi:hypothetical protein